jgi:pimeloyl-ACP methyl ester carboxylesterase
LYSGGGVDPRDYAPAAGAIAGQGFLVVIVPMPLNLAFLAPEKRLAVIDKFEQVETWMVAGHSLGGAMAAWFAGQHPDRVSGLV